MNTDDSTKIVAEPSGTVRKADRETRDASPRTSRPSLDDVPVVDFDPLLRGTSVGRYVVIDAVATGGMGAIYNAYDPELDRRVALKMLRRTDLEDLGGEGLLLREAQAMAKLSHPNVVNVYDTGAHEGQIFVAMEFVDGVTLRRWLADEQRDWREILTAFIAAGRGLAAAHAVGIVHRDFKPTNVMIDTDGRCRVLDFGLARPAQTADSDASVTSSANVRIPMERLGDVGRSTVDNVRPTRQRREHKEDHDGLIFGTPSYMSPEQWLGGQIDARSDQFSFCVALWDAIYGSKPFVGERLQDLRRAVLEKKIVDPRTPRGPAALRRHLERGLSGSRDNRYPTIDELLADLESDLHGARRRNTSIAVAVGAIGLIGVGYGAASTADSADAESPCAGADERLAGVWDDDRRTEVASAFASTQTAYADDVLATVRARLDEHAAAWVAMYADACEATHVRKEQSAELFDRRMFCLDRQRRDVRATVDLLAEADVSVVQGAVKLVESVPDVSECSYAVTAASDVAPPPPEIIAELDEVYDELTRGRALGVAARLDEAEKVFAEAIPRARELGYGPVLAKGLVFLSDIRIQNGHAGDAEDLALESVQTSIRSHDDTLSARTTALLIAIHAFEGRADEAEVWERQSRAWLERVGDPSALRVNFENNAGLVDFARGNLESAQRHYERSVELARTDSTAKTFRLGNILNNLGSVAGMRGNHEESLVYLEEALEVFKAILGERHPLTAVTIGNIAGAKGALGDPRGAYEDFRVALEIKREALGENNREVALAYHNVASSLSNLGDDAEALSLMRKALTIKDETLGADHMSTALSRANVGYILRRLGKPEEALPEIVAARAVLDPLGDEHPYLQFARLAHGQTLLDLRRPAEAREILAPMVHAESHNDPKTAAEGALSLARAAESSGASQDEVAEITELARTRFLDMGPAGQEGLAGLDRWLSRKRAARSK